MSNFRPSFPLEDLLDEPFGPFTEASALSPRVHSSTLKNPLVLHSVSLEAGPGVITGLDECEQCQPGHDRKRFRNNLQVLFTGILDVDNPAWLTTQAIHTIQKELRKRDHIARLAIDPRARHRDNSFDFLHQALANGSKTVKLIIQAIKSQPASFMQSKQVPNGLLLISSFKHQSNPERPTSTNYRRYKVPSLHIATYERSRRYLRRWRLFWELQELLALDAGPGKSFRDNKTPLAERTPEWFVELYTRHKAYADEQRSYRIHYDSGSDSDIQPGSGGSLKPGRQHVPRDVSRADIRFRLERDGEWVAGQANANQQSRWLNKGVWAEWLADLGSKRTMRQRIRQSDVSEIGYVSLGDDAKARYFAPNPSRSAPRPRVVKKRASNRIVMSRSSSPAVTSDDGVDVDETMMRTYDPDFSPASTTLGSPISSPSRPSTPVDPNLLALLPAELWHPPNVNSQLMWTCPWNDCLHTIDLLHPTDDDMDHPAISDDDKRRFRNQLASWDGGDVWARDAFAYMADKHHFWHLDQAGIDVEVIDGRYLFRWRHPSSHHRFPELRRVKTDNREPKAEEIKQEDV